MKTRQCWRESKKSLTEYLQEGDAVDMEIIDYVIGVLPPVTMTGKVIQMGEPYDSCPITGKARYITFEKKRRIGYDYSIDGDWEYVGLVTKC